MRDTVGNEISVNAEVIVSGQQDGKEFSMESGVVVSVGGVPCTVLIRFDDWEEGHGAGDNEWHFHDSDNGGWVITQHGQRTIGPSTYLNGLEDQIEFKAATAAEPDEPARPRFMTAWIHADDFAQTGDAFMTLDHAEAFARETLKNDGQEGQIAVFELRSVHLARLDITSEAA